MCADEKPDIHGDVGLTCFMNCPGEGGWFGGGHQTQIEQNRAVAGCDATGLPAPNLFSHNYLRWRMRLRIFRFFRPIFRRPLPVFLTPIRPALPSSVITYEFASRHIASGGERIPVAANSIKEACDSLIVSLQIPFPATPWLRYAG